MDSPPFYITSPLVILLYFGHQSPLTLVQPRNFFRRSWLTFLRTLGTYTIKLEDSTIQAVHLNCSSNAIKQSGGCIFLSRSAVTIEHSTFAQNSVPDQFRGAAIAFGD